MTYSAERSEIKRRNVTIYSQIYFLTIEWLIDVSHDFICISMPFSDLCRLFSLLKKICRGKIDSRVLFSRERRLPFRPGRENGPILINYWQSFATESISKAFVIAIFYQPSIVKIAYSNIYWWCHKLHEESSLSMKTVFPFFPPSPPSGFFFSRRKKTKTNICL